MRAILRRVGDLRRVDQDLARRRVAVRMLRHPPDDRQIAPPRARQVVAARPPVQRGHVELLRLIQVHACADASRRSRRATHWPRHECDPVGGLRQCLRAPPAPPRAWSHRVGTAASARHPYRPAGRPPSRFSSAELQLLRLLVERIGPRERLLRVMLLRFGTGWRHTPAPALLRRHRPGRRATCARTAATRPLTPVPGQRLLIHRPTCNREWLAHVANSSACQ